MPDKGAAFHARIVGNQRHILRQLEADAARIAATQIKMIVIHHRGKNGDQPLHPLVPFLVADLAALALADIGVEIILVMDRHMRQLHVWHQFAVAKPRGAESRAKRANQLQPLAPHHGEALHIRIIVEPRGLAEFPLDRLRQPEAFPGPGTEIGGGMHHTVAHIAGKADRDVIVIRQRRDQFGQRRQNMFRGRACGRLDPQAFRQEFSLGVDDRGFKPGAADVDGENLRGGCFSCGRACGHWGDFPPAPG